MDSISLENLLSCTIKCKQYVAYDFAKLSNFPYISQLKPNNMNLSLFFYGTIKHLLLLSNGTLPAISNLEFNARLQHILNVLEIVCLESDLTDFESYSWKVAREYDSKIIKDIEAGFKKWLTLDQCIDSSAWTYAQKMITRGGKGGNQNSKSQNNSQKMCTTWNTFRKDGCSFEHNNPEERCIFLHHCSTCKNKGFPGRRHKSINCKEDFNSKSNSNNSKNPGSITFNTTSSSPVVTSV